MVNKHLLAYFLLFGKKFVRKVMDVDDTDRKILEILRRDAQTPNARIGKAVGLSEGAIRKRILRLKQAGIIKRFTIETAEETPAVAALLFVSTDPRVPTESISRKIARLSGVSKVYEITGEYDICVFIVSTETKHLNRVIEEIRHMPHVKDTKTQIMLKKWK